MNASGQAMDELDRGKRQILHYILDQGQASLETLSRHLQLREETIRSIVSDLEKEDLVKRIGNNVYLVELI